MLRALIAARAELAGLEESLSALPNPQVFIQSLALLEAQASSEIENIVTTTDELFRAETLAGREKLYVNTDFLEILRGV
ncbi:hypothetical protein I6H58_05905 [Rothia kristinae]|uniref:Fic/DOC N-terminal domain-containing protein n=1 Tax=Rothia kristinae TaxID=37923 RepID=A0A7T4MVP7_9MICC|nr:hypothetical protein I6H58_05905 [Rothia kristinae]